MPFSVTCPGCRTTYRLADDLRGSTLRCNQCQQRFEAVPTDAPRSAGPADATGPRRPTASVLPQPKVPPAAGSTPRGVPLALVIGGAVAGVLSLLVLGALLVWAVVTDSGPDRSAEEAARILVGSAPAVTPAAPPTPAPPPAGKPPNPPPAAPASGGPSGPPGPS